LQQVKQALLDRNQNLPHLLGTARHPEEVDKSTGAPIVPERAEANLHPALLCSALPAQRFVLTHLMRKLLAESQG
jgi:hypothetical protein